MERSNKVNIFNILLILYKANDDTEGGERSMVSAVGDGVIGSLRELEA